MHECFALAFSAQSGYFDHFLENAYFITPFCGLERFFARHFAAAEPPAGTPPWAPRQKRGPNQRLICSGELLGRPICPVNTPIAIP